MSSLIDSRCCSVPTFQQTNLATVENCGKLNGYIGAAIFSVFIIALAIYLYIQVNKKDPDPEKQKDKNKVMKNILITIGLIILLLILWLGLPALNVFFSRRQWQEYQAQIDDLIAQGMSRTQALEKIQSIY